MLERLHATPMNASSTMNDDAFLTVRSVILHATPMNASSRMNDDAFLTVRSVECTVHKVNIVTTGGQLAPSCQRLRQRHIKAGGTRYTVDNVWSTVYCVLCTMNCVMCTVHCVL